MSSRTAYTPFARKRIAVGLTQAQLADKLGICRMSVCLWEKPAGAPGATTPSPQHIPKLAKILRVSADDVIDLFIAAPVAA